MLVLALQFSRAAPDLLPGVGGPREALAVIAGRPVRPPATSSSALPVRGLLPQNGTVTSGNFGSRWCLLVQPKLKAGVGMCP